MTELISDYFDLPLDETSISVYLTSDHRLFVCFADLCALLGLDWKVHHLYLMTDPYLREQLAIFRIEHLHPGRSRRRDTLFFDLAALSYWLGTLTHRPIRNKKAQGRVLQFSIEYATFSWELMNAGYVHSRKETRKNALIQPKGFSQS